MDTKHTATQRLEACGNLIRYARTADNPSGFLFAEVPTNTGHANEDAEFIVRACNRDHLFDDLVKALEIVKTAAEEKPFLNASDLDHLLVSVRAAFAKLGEAA